MAVRLLFVARRFFACTSSGFLIGARRSCCFIASRLLWKRHFSYSPLQYARTGVSVCPCKSICLLLAWCPPREHNENWSQSTDSDTEARLVSTEKIVGIEAKLKSGGSLTDLFSNRFSPVLRFCFGAGFHHHPHYRLGPRGAQHYATTTVQGTLRLRHRCFNRFAMV